jgi:hypothetical protein
MTQQVEQDRKGAHIVVDQSACDGVANIVLLPAALVQHSDSPTCK